MVMSKRQARKARKAVLKAPRVQPVAADRPCGVSEAAAVAVDANRCEHEAAALAIQVAEQDAARAGRALTRADRTAIREDYGAGKMGEAARMRSRDGLASLLASGSLGADLVKAGLAYRYCFETAAAGLKSGLGSVEGGGRTLALGLMPRSAAALHRAYVIARLAQMERQVGAAMVDGRELHVLRAVAGEGRALSSLASGGNAKVANLAALRRALEAVLQVLPARGLRIGDD